MKKELRQHINKVKARLKHVGNIRRDVFFQEQIDALRTAITELTEAVELMSEPFVDTLGECLGCGAKNGQPCFRHCGKGAE